MIDLFETTLLTSDICLKQKIIASKEDKIV